MAIDIIENLKKYNEKHPEYDGNAFVIFYDDESGHFEYRDEYGRRIDLENFISLKEFDQICNFR